jgi:hypothetical protein
VVNAQKHDLPLDDNLPWLNLLGEAFSRDFGTNLGTGVLNLAEKIYKATIEHILWFEVAQITFQPSQESFSLAYVFHET